MGKNNFGPILRARRCALHLTQEQLAQRLGVSSPYIGHLESEKRKPSNEVIGRLAKVLGLDPTELLFLVRPAVGELIGAADTSKASSAWQEFAGDLQRQGIHKIEADEMEALTRVAAMGNVGSARDFVHILTVIRTALGRW